jgi:hypothetical protein
LTIFQPTTPHSNAIVRPMCPECGTKMLLARIEPEEPKKELRTFNCAACDHSLKVTAPSG